MHYWLSWHTYIILVFGVMPVHEFQELDLDLRLVEEGFLVFDDLDGHLLLVPMVIGLHHLKHNTQCQQFSLKILNTNTDR